MYPGPGNPFLKRLIISIKGGPYQSMFHFLNRCTVIAAVRNFVSGRAILYTHPYYSTIASVYTYMQTSCMPSWLAKEEYAHENFSFKHNAEPQRCPFLVHLF